MKGIRLTIRASMVALLVALMSTFFGGLAHAQDPNTLTVHSPDAAQAPHSYALWTLPGSTIDAKAQLAQLAPLDDEQIAAAYPAAVRHLAATDAQGIAGFANLPDGHYYLRAALPSGASTSGLVTPLILDLPQASADGTPVRTVDVYPKVVTTPVTPVVPATGGERFLKVGDDGKPLAKATFAVHRRPSPDRSEPVVLSGKALVVTSAADGTLAVRDLPHGTYALIETRAPEGYRLLTNPIQFTITDTSYDDTTVIRIVNTKKPPVAVPKTGDVSLLLSLSAAAILIGMGIHLSRRPRPSQAE